MNGSWARVTGPRVAVGTSVVFWPAIVNFTVCPTFTVGLLGKNALIVKRCPAGARPASIVPAATGLAAAVFAAAGRRLSSVVPAVWFCASVGILRRLETTRTVPFIPEWTTQ